MRVVGCQMKKTTPASLDDLKPAPYNPRQISDDAAAGLRYSMESFGDLSGVVWNSRTGHLVCGHQRVGQLRSMGAALHDGSIKTSQGDFPVRVVDWPEGKEKAANVAANNRHIAGEFTPDLAPLLVGVEAFLGEGAFDDLRLNVLSEGGPLGPLVDPVGFPDIPSGDKSAVQSMTFILSDSQADTVREAVSKIRASGHGPPGDDVGPNANGWGLALICRGYLDGR